MSALDSLKFDANGLIPAIAQDAETGEVLMMAWMNRESLRRTLESGLATYWSRSRGEFWVKGLTSGHTQRVRTVSVDCDADALLLKVDQTGAACHENYRSCFFRDLSKDEALALNATPKLDALRPRSTPTSSGCSPGRSSPSSRASRRVGRSES